LEGLGAMSEQRRVVSIVETTPPKTFLQKMLDGVERVGNKVPHPAIIFFPLTIDPQQILS
jgi:hypothetical protein